MSKSDGENGFRNPMFNKTLNSFVVKNVSHIGSNFTLGVVKTKGQITVDL